MPEIADRAGSKDVKVQVLIRDVLQPVFDHFWPALGHMEVAVINSPTTGGRNWMTLPANLLTDMAGGSSF